MNTSKFKKCSKNKNYCLWRGLNIFLVLSCIIFGLTYIIEINSLTIQGFQLRELSAKSRVLAEKHQELQVEALNLQSYSSVSSRLADLNMVAVDEVIYISAQESVLARK